MTVSVATSVNRHVNLNYLMDYIVENNLSLDEFVIKGDIIRLQVSGQSLIDTGLFEEFLGDLEHEFDKEQFAL